MREGKLLTGETKKGNRMINSGSFFMMVKDRVYSLFHNTGKETVTTICLIVIVPFLFLYAVPSLQDNSAGISTFSMKPFESGVNDQVALQKAELEKEVALLKRKLGSFAGNSPYLVINTFENTFRLYNNKRISREGICSTGSYVLLRNGENQKWLFQTPKGLFRVQTKTTSPVWKKPDWAFVEEGLSIPPADDASRFEYGVLGDYALGIGDGYLIHGTLYQRFLGLPVTHGCIRMNDEDLEKVYMTLGIGSKIYIY